MEENIFNDIKLIQNELMAKIGSINQNPIIIEPLPSYSIQVDENHYFPYKDKQKTRIIGKIKL